MAIFGHIDDIIRHIPLNKRILMGLNYLKELTSDSFLELNEGEPIKVSIDGEKLFAQNQMYRTKSMEMAKFEAHRQYIDLQYVIDGIEIIQSSCIADCRTQSEYDSKNDVQFFTSEFSSSITLRPETVCILYPEDIHAPGLSYESPRKVLKSVVKVRIV